MRYRHIFFLAVLLAGCSRSPPANAELNAARELWQLSNIRSYHFRCDRIQGGTFEYEPELIEVVDGEVVSIRTLNGVPQYNSYQACFEFRKVAAMFELIQSKHDAKKKLEVEYDPKYGYPTVARIDKLEGPDRPYTIEITEFTVTNPTL